MNPITHRLLNQQLASPQLSSPADIVSWMGAVQAQDIRAARWAVLMRSRKPSSATFAKEFNDGLFIRTHLLRCTWQFIAAEDFEWMRQLCAPKALSTMRGWMNSNKISIPEDEEKLVSGIIESALDGKSLLKDDIVGILSKHGIRMDDHRLSYHIRLAELSGLVCSGDFNPLKNSWSLVRDKIKVRQESITREEALNRMAVKYFQSHSPATLEDFVWWSGLNAGDCKEAIMSLGQEIHKERHRDREFHIHDSCRSRGFRKGSVLLLPPYDEYLIGYKSRDIVLDPLFSHKAHNNSGIFRPIVAVDGEIVGNWSMTSPDSDVKLFKHDIELPEKALSDQLNLYCNIR